MALRLIMNGFLPLEGNFNSLGRPSAPPITNERRLPPRSNHSYKSSENFSLVLLVPSGSNNIIEWPLEASPSTLFVSAWLSLCQVVSTSTLDGRNLVWKSIKFLRCIYSWMKTNTFTVTMEAIYSLDTYYRHLLTKAHCLIFFQLYGYWPSFPCTNKMSTDDWSFWDLFRKKIHRGGIPTNLIILLS